MKLFNIKHRLLIHHYKKWRELGKELAHKILKEVPTDVMREAAHDLRMINNDGVMIFNSEDETCYLMDRAIYDMERDGKRYVDRYFEKNKDIVSSREKRLLEAMKDSIYSLFIVGNIKHGIGMYITDVFNAKEFLLLDINLSQTIQEQCLLSCRIISIDKMHFTSGCASIFEQEMLAQLKDNFLHLFEHKKRSLSWQQMMRKYNPYFLKIMKQTGKQVYFS